MKKGTFFTNLFVLICVGCMYSIVLYLGYMDISTYISLGTLTVISMILFWSCFTGLNKMTQITGCLKKVRKNILKLHVKDPEFVWETLREEKYIFKNSILDGEFNNFKKEMNRLEDEGAIYCQADVADYINEDTIFIYVKKRVLDSMAFVIGMIGLIGILISLSHAMGIFQYSSSVKVVMQCLKPIVIMIAYTIFVTVLYTHMYKVIMNNMCKEYRLFVGDFYKYVVPFAKNDMANSILYLQQIQMQNTEKLSENVIESLSDKINNTMIRQSEKFNELSRQIESMTNTLNRFNTGIEEFSLNIKDQMESDKVLANNQNNIVLECFNQLKQEGIKVNGAIEKEVKVIEESKKENIENAVEETIEEPKQEDIENVVEETIEEPKEEKKTIKKSTTRKTTKKVASKKSTTKKSEKKDVVEDKNLDSDIDKENVEEKDIEKTEAKKTTKKASAKKTTTKKTTAKKTTKKATEKDAKALSEIAEKRIKAAAMKIAEASNTMASESVEDKKIDAANENEVVEEKKIEELKELEVVEEVKAEDIKDTEVEEVKAEDTKEAEVDEVKTEEIKTNEVVVDIVPVKKRRGRKTKAEKEAELKAALELAKKAQEEIKARTLEEEAKIEEDSKVKEETQEEVKTEDNVTVEEVQEEVKTEDNVTVEEVQEEIKIEDDVTVEEVQEEIKTESNVIAFRKESDTSENHFEEGDIDKELESNIQDEIVEIEVEG